MFTRLFLPALLLAFISTNASAAIIGTNSPAVPLTLERIATLPKKEQPAWKKYLKNSERQKKADQAAFAKELREYKIEKITMPPHGGSGGRLPARQPAEWYAQAEAQRIADIIVSFQTPAGGWSKNMDMTQHPRAPGEQYATDNNSPRLSPQDNDIPHDLNWNYVGTFDNGATITQLRYLAKVIGARGVKQSGPYLKAFQKGLDYISSAQYPNGGWPQVWPLQGGYHDAITYNDDAMLNIMDLLNNVASGTNEFAFTTRKQKSVAVANVQRGLACILASQINVNGHLTVWCQQHDVLTLAATSARNYEMPSECAAESAKLMLFLMRQPNPDAKMVTAINAAAAWFEKTELHDVVYRMTPSEGRQRISVPGSPVVWARYYDITTDQPIFGDRDKTIHDDVNEISRERRNGYRWYNDDPQNALDQFTSWSKNHGGTVKTNAGF